jgi:transcriptional regulator with XRE-family HTH domain
MPKTRQCLLPGWTFVAVFMHTGRMTHDAPDWGGLGADLKARRERLRLSRADIHAAGGPSPASVQRIENGEVQTSLKTTTKDSLEKALRLAPGSIDKRLAGGSLIENEPPRIEVMETSGERVLMLIMNGVGELPEADRRTVLKLVRALQERD